MILDRYLFREWAKSFGIAVGAILGLLLIGKVYDELPGFLSRGTEMSTILRFYALLIPGYLPNLLPICFLISLLFCLGNLQRSSEITAIRAAGYSLLRLSRAFWFAGILLSLLLLWLNAHLVPVSQEAARNLVETAKNKPPEDGSIRVQGRARDLGVFLPEEETLWFVEAFMAQEKRAYGVTVFFLEDGKDRGRIEAARADYLPAARAWIFQNGFQVVNEEDSSLPKSTEFFEEKVFLDTTMTPEVFLGLSQRPRDLSLFEVRALLTGLPGSPDLSPYQMRYYSMLFTPLHFFIVLMIALPVALGTGRSSSAQGITRAVWYFVLFLMMNQVCLFLGGKSYVPPLTAALLPLAVGWGWGLWMFRRNA